MSDLIDRQAAIDAVCLRECKATEPCDIECKSVQAIRDLPSIEPKRKKGKWQLYGAYKDKHGNSHNLFECDLCGWLADDNGDFCPNCGADMRGEENGDNC